MTRPDVTCFGEAMIELSLPGASPTGPARVSFAGDTFNAAVYMKRQAPELRVAYATQVGRDKFSDGFLAQMEEEGLDTSLVRRSDTLVPGIYAISTDPLGERSFTYWRDQSAARAMFEPPGLRPEDLGAGLLYFSAISLAILPAAHQQALLDWLPDYRRTGGTVAFDSNFRPVLWPDRARARALIGAFWQQTDIALPSVEDEAAIFGDTDEDATMARLRALGLKRGVLKRGQIGPRAFSGVEGGPYPPVTRVVDSTSAGDSFNAAYLASLLQGKDEAAALQAGHNLAVRVIGIRGALLPRETERAG